MLKVNAEGHSAASIHNYESSAAGQSPLSPQLVFKNGRLVEIAVPPATECSTCHMVSLESLSCPCGKDIKCRECVTEYLVSCKGQLEPSQLCKSCDDEILEDAHKTATGYRLYEKVRPIINNNLESKHITWSIIPYGKVNDTTQANIDSFYQNLIGTVPFSPTALAWELVKNGVVMLGSKSAINETQEQTIQGGTGALIEALSVKINIQPNTLPDGAQADVRSTTLLTMPIGLKAQFKDMVPRPGVTCSAYHILSSSKTTEPVTVKLEHSLSEDTQLIGLKVDLSEKPLRFEHTPITTSEGYANFTLPLSSKPDLLMVATPYFATTESDYDRYIAQQRSGLEALPTLPLVGSSS